MRKVLFLTLFIQSTILFAQEKVELKNQDGVFVSYTLTKIDGDEKKDQYTLTVQAENKNDFDVFYTGTASTASASLVSSFTSIKVSKVVGFLAANSLSLNGSETGLFTTRNEPLFRINKGQLVTRELTFKVKTGDIPVITCSFSRSLKKEAFYEISKGVTTQQPNSQSVSSGFAMNFTNNSSVVVSNNNAYLPIRNNARTISAWIKPTSNHYECWGVIYQGKSDCDRLMFGIGLVQGNKLSFWGGCFDIVSKFTVPLNVWSYVAITYNGYGNYTFHLNGQTYSEFKEGALNTQSSKFFVGAESVDNGNSFRQRYKGLIDEVKVYSKALTQYEINADILGRNSTSSLVLYYPFNEGAGNSIIDNSKSNNASIVNQSSTNWAEGYPMPMNNQNNYGNSQPSSNNSLSVNQEVRKNNSLNSFNNIYTLLIQDDGNLCINKNVGGRFVYGGWCSMTNGKNSNKLILQEDGNLVIYDFYNKALWSSETTGYFNSRYGSSTYKPVRLALEDDGRLVLYSASGRQVWANGSHL